MLKILNSVTQTDKSYSSDLIYSGLVINNGYAFTDQQTTEIVVSILQKPER